MTLKSTISVNGGAVPKFNRAEIMARAWAIFRSTYGFPKRSFSQIGRPCFSWALKKAWAEARKVVQSVAVPNDQKLTRVAALERSIALEQFNDCWPQVKANIARMRAEIHQLSAWE